MTETSLDFESLNSSPSIPTSFWLLFFFGGGGWVRGGGLLFFFVCFLSCISVKMKYKGVLEMCSFSLQYILSCMLPVVWSLISKFIFHRCHFLSCGKWENLALPFKNEELKMWGLSSHKPVGNMIRFSHRRCQPVLKHTVFLLNVNDLVPLKLSLKYIRLGLSVLILQRSALSDWAKSMGSFRGTGKVSVWQHL